MKEEGEDVHIDVIPEWWFVAEYQWAVLELLRSIDVSADERTVVYKEWADRAGVMVTPEALEALGSWLAAEVV